MLLKAMGIVAFVLGVLGWLWVGKRGFDRMNAYGCMEFNGYLHMLFFKLSQIVLFCGSVLFVIFGFLGFCLGYGLGR